MKKQPVNEKLMYILAMIVMAIIYYFSTKYAKL
jgi:hypothetical protein